MLAGLRTAAARDRAAAAADRERAAADRAAAAADRRQSRVDLSRAHLDDLTGVYARGLGQEILRNEVARAHRLGYAFTIAFLDVDALEGLNERDGHAAGDLFLRAVADAIRLRMRSYDPVVRVGGDEFVCGLAGSGAHSTVRRVEEVRAALALSHPGTIDQRRHRRTRAPGDAGGVDRAGRQGPPPSQTGETNLMPTQSRTKSVRRELHAERALLLSERARWAAAWAQTHAERGDYQYALRWLELVRKSSGGLSPAQLEKRRTWRQQLEAGRPIRSGDSPQVG